MFDRKTRAHRWLMFKFEDNKWWAPWWLEGLLQKTLCFLTGHTPERDQCGIPDHDYCLWCQKSMPNTWIKPGEHRA
ncbi:MAG TPA: hypothetical protein VIY48_01745 [Candidatus Paceibacterota bacterium]